jgi:hypothetical protein
MSDPIEEALSLMVDCAERAAALEALAVLRGESADYSSLRRELRTIYGEGAPRKGESWPAYYLRLIADDRAAAEASVVSLEEVLRAYSAFDDVIDCLSDARREQYRTLQVARAALASSEGEGDA